MNHIEKNCCCVMNHTKKKQSVRKNTKFSNVRLDGVYVYNQNFKVKQPNNETV